MRARPATSSRSRSNLPGHGRPRMRIPGDSARMTETCVESRLRGNDGHGEETRMPNGKKPTAAENKKLRSRQWFDNPDNPDMTALYLERYMNYGLTREELSSGKPIIGIAQPGSDPSPCNRHHLLLAPRVREGIREAGGIAFEFPVHPI